MSDLDRIKELEEQVKAYAESAFVARKLLGEALFKISPNYPTGRFSLHLVETDSTWKNVHQLASKRVYEMLHLGRMQSKSEKNPEAVQAFEAAIAELEKT